MSTLEMDKKGLVPKVFLESDIRNPQSIEALSLALFMTIYNLQIL